MVIGKLVTCKTQNGVGGSIGQELLTEESLGILFFTPYQFIYIVAQLTVLIEWSTGA